MTGTLIRSGINPNHYGMEEVYGVIESLCVDYFANAFVSRHEVMENFEKLDPDSEVNLREQEEQQNKALGMFKAVN